VYFSQIKKYEQKPCICSIKRGKCRVGLPWRELPETCFCHCNISQTEVVEIKHCKSGLPTIWQAGLGQGFYTRP